MIIILKNDTYGKYELYLIVDFYTIESGISLLQSHLEVG